MSAPPRKRLYSAKITTSFGWAVVPYRTPNRASPAFTPTKSPPPNRSVLTGPMTTGAKLRVGPTALAELEFLAERDREARAGLRLARRYRVIDATGSADDALLDLAGTNRAVVVTNDQPLLERLREKGIPRLFLRSRNHLVAEGL